MSPVARPSDEARFHDCEVCLLPLKNGGEAAKFATVHNATIAQILVACVRQGVDPAHAATYRAPRSDAGVPRPGRGSPF